MAGPVPGALYRPCSPEPSVPRAERCEGGRGAGPASRTCRAGRGCAGPGCDVDPAAPARGPSLCSALLRSLRAGPAPPAARAAAEPLTMSWFNASQLSSFAKQALSQAQKSIDRVLDIQAEESPWPDAVIPDYGDGKGRAGPFAPPAAPLCPPFLGEV